jgi:hypothetical protein
MGADLTRTENEEAKIVAEDDSRSSPAAAGKSVSSNSSVSFADRAGLGKMGSGINAVSSQNTHSPSEYRKEKSCKKLPSSQYKGVVPQPNGRWGAQIYEKHQRVWLGTFNCEEDAARAYDRAAIKLRGAETITNFNFVDRHPEAFFLRGHSKSEIVDMLRRHTYDEEFDNNERTSFAAYPDIALSTTPEPREHLFDKAVTPSDVGKLNRLVIPKQYAEKHFPLDAASIEDRAKGVLLNFEDISTEKIWRFRYSYWNSSQSYVLTKGWNRFVKEKRLQAGDIVTFERNSGSRRLFITFRRPSRYLLPHSAPPPPLKRCPLTVNPFTVKGYPHREQFFYTTPPPPEVQNPAAHCPIPWVAGPNSVDFLSTPKSMSDDRKRPSVDFVDQRRSPPSTDGNCDSSSVWLFGVNLQLSPLNFCSGITVEEETEHAKRKTTAEAFSGGKRRCDTAVL